MSVSKSICTAVGVFVLSSTAALAWEGAGRAYPYAGAENNCPAGLQPVVVGGVICCGTPTTHISYQAMKRHPVVKRVKHTRQVVKQKRVVRKLRHKTHQISTSKSPYGWD